MGFPIPYAGVLPKILLTAAISMAAIRDGCTSLLQSLGIPLMRHHSSDAQNQQHFAADSDHQQWYFNPHLHAADDTHLVLRRRAFAKAVQSSLPAVRFESLPSKLSQEQAAAVGSSACIAAEDKLQGLGAAAESESYTIHDTVGGSLRTAAGEVQAIAYKMPHNQQETLRSAQSSSADGAPAEHRISQNEPEDNQPAIIRAKRSFSCAADAGELYSDQHLQQRAECAVCLWEFESGQEVRVLPFCSHIFHKECIDGWLLHDHRTCPLCRTSLLTPEIALQEKLHEQELSDQLTSWFTALQEEHESAYHDHLRYHQDFHYTLPAGWQEITMH
eukprot:c17047_g1_i1 orf=534-1526(-)